MKSKLIALVLFMILCSMLAGCSNVKSGKVVDKLHWAEYVTFTYMCASYSAQGACVGTVMIPQFWPEGWSLELDNGEDTGTLIVDAETFRRYHFGDQYP